MAAVLTEPKTQILIEEHVILSGVSWKTYESLMKEHEDRSVPRFTYNRGCLEIYMPSQKHEKKAEFLTDIVKTFAEEREIELLSIRSTTFKKDELEKGAEPDGCFYLQSYDKVFGMQKIDLEQFPPDLVLEIDIFSPSIDRLPIYAAFKIPEIWRFQKDEVKIYIFDGEKYAEKAESIAFPKATSEKLTNLLAESETEKRSAWLKKVREAARD
ncbi:MAG TPA: Uma2 family endonuclease [Pyrinomonadaceae bacterium]|nr:Uma2 family endonuclease [Pyrinomonadaceae bacterium]